MYKSFILEYVKICLRFSIKLHVSFLKNQIPVGLSLENKSFSNKVSNSPNYSNYNDENQFLYEELSDCDNLPLTIESVYKQWRKTWLPTPSETISIIVYAKIDSA